MFIVSMILKDGGTQPVAATFDNVEDARKFYNSVNTQVGGHVSVRDDYHSEIVVDRSAVIACTLLDLNKEYDRQSQIQLRQSRAQMKAQRMASEDPTLKLLQSVNGGPRA